jgi:protein SCO1/2
MRLGLALVFAIGVVPVAPAHVGVTHATTTETTAHEAASITGPALPFPIEITPRFALIDQTGRAVTQADFAGRPMVIFFGYANCPGICPVALAYIAEALDILGPDGADIAPILITVDPARDTPAAMAEALAKYHPRLIGLTGSEAALAEVRAVFQVEASQVAETPDGAPLYAHGSFIYLVGRDGVVKSLLPPILSPERIAELMRKYL